jgi:hypothetical protein
VDAALAWIAFGSALRRWDWDNHLFIGAADLMTRHEVLQRLDQLSAEPGTLDAFLERAPELSAGLDDVPPSLRKEVAALASRLQARQTRQGRTAHLERFVRCSAKLLRRRYLRQFRNDTRWDGYGRDEDMEALADAEFDLLRRIGADKIPAHGWPGGYAPEREIIQPRQRILPELCAGPVSFDHHGALLPCARSDTRRSVAPLFSEILIPADKLLAEWPQPKSKDDEVAREVSVPAEKRRTGNRRGPGPTHDWDAFWIEVCHWVSLNIDKDGFQPEDRPRLQTHMEDWTATNPPDGKEAMVKSTARRKLQKLEERLTASGTPATQR